MARVRYLLFYRNDLLNMNKTIKTILDFSNIINQSLNRNFKSLAVAYCHVPNDSVAHKVS